ncbi:hypothetical protein C5610_02580 [Idiomarina sp. OT37-5b]|nr:hypothetical protein C5610_02580 [Idiomarina sp. OT37-5b]
MENPIGQGLCLPLKDSALSAPSAVNKKDLLTAEAAQYTQTTKLPNHKRVCIVFKNKNLRIS